MLVQLYAYPVPPGLHLNITNFWVFWNALIYTCNMGHQIIGPEERVCQASGMWSGQEPYCKKTGKTDGDYIWIGPEGILLSV